MKKIILAVLLLMASTAQAQPTIPSDIEQLQGDARCRAYSYTIMQGGKMIFCRQDTMCNIYCN